MRIVYAALEFAGELIGLQMGLNFAGFFDPGTGAQGTATSRFFGSLVAFLFIAINGHLLLIQALVQSFHSFPVRQEPFAFLRAARAAGLGSGDLSGLWIALPLVTMLTFVNLVLGSSRAWRRRSASLPWASPVTVSVGLLGMVATLPLMQTPFSAALGGCWRRSASAQLATRPLRIA